MTTADHKQMYYQLRHAIELVESALRHPDYRYSASVPLDEGELLWTKHKGTWRLCFNNTEQRQFLVECGATTRLEAAHKLNALLCAIEESRANRSVELEHAIQVMVAFADRLDEALT